MSRTMTQDARLAESAPAPRILWDRDGRHYRVWREGTTTFQRLDYEGFAKARQVCAWLWLPFEEAR